MTICLADSCRSAFPNTRRLLSKLARRGVVNASGCVIKASAAMGEPPAGHDRVLIRMATGFPPVSDAENLDIQGTVAAEIAAIVRDLLPNEIDADCMIETSYAVSIAEDTISLGITVHGLVDHEIRVLLK